VLTDGTPEAIHTAARLKTPRISMLGACVLLAGGLVSGSAQARPRIATTCSVRHAITLFDNRQVRVFRLARRNPHGRRFLQTNGCLRGTGRLVILDNPDPSLEQPGHVRLFRVAGDYVGDAITYRSVDGVDVFITVGAVNLRSGKVHGAGAVSAPEGGGSDQLMAFVVNDAGALAWIAYNDGQLPPDYQVAELPRGGDPFGRGTVLDHGTDVDPGSLALSADGTTVYWRRAGAVRSASLH
jgi:hypothetical protein